MDREGEEQEVGSGELTRKRIKARSRSRTPLKHTKKPAPRTFTHSQIFQASFPQTHTLTLQRKKKREGEST